MPSAPNHLGISESAVSKAVARMIRDASVDIELTVQRYLARGEKFPAKIEAELYRALQGLAEQYAIDLKSTAWGREIEAAARKGAGAVSGVTFDLSKDQIDIVLSNAGHKIKNILAPGIAEVQDIVATGMIRGDSLRTISKAVQARVQIEGGVIDRARADLIARNEVFGAYRQTSKAAAAAEGITLYQMTGPMDSRTTAICAAHVGQVKTEAEWNAIRANALTWGLHYSCRHSFDPVRSADSPGVKRGEEWGKKQRARLKAAA